ncbi:MAG TPA: SpoIIE family protein phosphatase [Bryobacteraceae bacterium]|nr:SpoIIE family protein phosphatase [Bryobacteraceae bacterium]
MTSAALEIKPPGSAPFRMPLEPLPFRIGRSPENHLVLRDNRASRSHAVIRLEDGEYRIEDAGSRNGIEVNGVKQQIAPLHHGDVVRFGVEDSYEITFVTESVPVFKTQATHGGLRKLRSMLEVARSLQGALSLDQILASVVDAALDITNSDRGFLLLTSGDTLETRIARQAGGRPLRENLEIPSKVLHKALRSRSELFSMRFDASGGDSALDSSILNLSLRSVVCVPLIKVRAGDMSETALVGTIADTIGLLYLDSSHSQAELTTSSRDLVQSLAIEASFVLENARLLEEERKKQKMEQELRIAQSIQQDLLPAAEQYPKTGWLRAAGLSIPSRLVGGDYFDIMPSGDGRFDIVMADVSGKGVSSALLASLLQGAFVISTAEQVPPSVVLERLNNFLLGRTSGEKYATIFLASIYRDAPMQWTNAGHCSPLLLRSSGDVYELSPTGMPVGMLDIAVWKDVAVQLESQDLLILYTDGVSEAMNRQREFYGVSRLVNALRANFHLQPDAITRAVHADIEAFTGGEPQRDDLTLLVLRFTPD